jgi:NAD(P)-dependent dehydrogenase (short-subunit alcohol dehydrogenase family)
VNRLRYMLKDELFVRTPEGMVPTPCAEMLALGRSTRLGRPSDIASTVAMLMSDDGEWINGRVISVDGGITIR